MLKKILVINLMLFSVSILAMESLAEQSESEAKEKSENIIRFDGQISFDLLPDEIKVYIFSFLVDIDLSNVDKPASIISNIKEFLSGKNFIDLRKTRTVKKDWSMLLNYCFKLKIKRYIQALSKKYEKNEENFNAAFLQICKKAEIGDLDIKVLDVLLKAGVKLDIRTDNCSTPLILVAYPKKEKVFLFFLNYLEKSYSNEEQQTLISEDFNDNICPLKKIFHESHESYEFENFQKIEEFILKYIKKFDFIWQLRFITSLLNHNFSLDQKCLIVKYDETVRKLLNYFIKIITDEQIIANYCEEMDLFKEEFIELLFFIN